METDDLLHADSPRDLIEGDDRTLWNLTSTGAAIAAGLATRSLLKLAWRRTTGDEPPRNPASSSVAWTDALAWTAATGVAVGVARLLARRGAAAGWDELADEGAPA